LSQATTTRNRVPCHTVLDANRTIQQSIEHSIRYHQKQQKPDPRPLQELDEEWDIERGIEANAQRELDGLTFGLLGKSRGSFCRRRSVASSFSTRLKVGAPESRRCAGFDFEPRSRSSRKDRR
jgi:hypothetical protein